MCKLTGEDIEGLSKVLSDALNINDLDTIVYASLGDRLFDEYVPTGDPKRVTIQKLLVALQQQGTTHLFLSAVYSRRLKNQDVVDAIRRLCPEAAVSGSDSGAEIEVQRAGQPQASGPTRVAAPGLQRNVRPNLVKLDIHIWVDKIARIERQVCRIEVGGNAVGTGFLVGPEVVLTNWHVVEGVRKVGTLADLGCRFDYLRLENGARQQGELVGLHADGCLSSTPYSPAEATQTPDTPLPTADQLDYALLRLAAPIGETAAGGQPRGWIKLPTEVATLSPGDPLLIVQHPDGSPMKLAMDTDAFISTNPNGTRIRYTTNTEAGSSGSPCFTMEWDLVALHHYGDPAWHKTPAYNQGVPATLIRSKIADDGHLKFLGA
ncbi:serine protease [Bradyrhizobium prioriisuperbiae]|uniref:trypsin-like serine peptidase n=1 Tax=Bradyrhizobium prioriisuperbiae TaxID=2854389 RepID=UPI0028E66E0A|nr:serine protease [Bradyrhizobium prioritasuperba]